MVGNKILTFNIDVIYENCRIMARLTSVITRDALPGMNTFQSQYFCFAAYTDDSKNRKKSDLSRESTHFDLPTSRQAAVVDLSGWVFSQREELEQD